MYGKIFEDIFDSSILIHGGDTIYVFIAMIVLSDPNGYVKITAPALAARIGKNLTDVETAIHNLESEDPYSTTPDEAGKRIIPLRELTGGQENRGWWIVNYTKYREKKDAKTIREQTRERVRRHRGKDVTQCNADVTLSNAPKRQGEEEGEEEGKINKRVNRATQAPKEFIISEDLKTWAKEQGLKVSTLEKETEKFLDYHRAKGSTFKDWNAAWRKWMRNAKEWSKDKPVENMFEGAL